jgi:hypothetical protein
VARRYRERELPVELPPFQPCGAWSWHVASCKAAAATPIGDPVTVDEPYEPCLLVRMPHQDASAHHVLHVTHSAISIDALVTAQLHSRRTTAAAFPREHGICLKEGFVEEIFPITVGMICGLLLGSLTARRRLAVGLVISIVAGFLATVLSGEWRISWAFLLIDIPLVAGCAVLGFVMSRAVVLRRSTGGWTL